MLTCGHSSWRSHRWAPSRCLPGGSHPLAADSALSAGAMSGAANTYAGVGGPIIAGFLKRQGWKREDYLRTQQVIFGVMNLVSIPLLGLPSVTPWQLLGAIALLPIGVATGFGVSKLISSEAALKVCEVLVLIVGLIAVVRSSCVAVGLIGGDPARTVVDNWPTTQFRHRRHTAARRQVLDVELGGQMLGQVGALQSGEHECARQ